MISHYLELTLTPAPRRALASLLAEGASSAEKSGRRTVPDGFAMVNGLSPLVSQDFSSAAILVDQNTN